MRYKTNLIQSKTTIPNVVNSYFDGIIPVENENIPKV
jgi:hypothetical protein